MFWIVIILYHGVHQIHLHLCKLLALHSTFYQFMHSLGIEPTTFAFIMPCQDVRTLKPRGLIRHGSPWDFPMAYYNGVFQFMSKIRSVVNISWLYLDVFLNNVKRTHSHTKHSYVVTYSITNIHLKKNWIGCMHSMGACNLCYRALFYS